jgi:cytochrome bd-type quinol oxidase subunit 2
MNGLETLTIWDQRFDAFARRRAFLGLAICWLAVTAACFWRPRLAREDGVIENMSMAGFFLSALIFSAIVVLGRSALPGRGLAFLAGVSAFCLLLFLSEVSFGARAFGTPVPDMYGGGEFDGGHDFVILTYRLLRDIGFPANAIALTLAGALMGALWLNTRRRTDLWLRAASLVQQEPLAGKLAAALALLAAAVLLDLGSGRLTTAMEETTELAASALLLRSACTQLRMHWGGGALKARQLRD